MFHRYTLPWAVMLLPLSGRMHALFGTNACPPTANAIGWLPFLTHIKVTLFSRCCQDLLDLIETGWFD